MLYNTVSCSYYRFSCKGKELNIHTQRKVDYIQLSSNLILNHSIEAVNVTFCHVTCWCELQLN